MKSFFITDSTVTALLDDLAASGTVLKSAFAKPTRTVRYVRHERGQPFEHTGFRAAQPLKGLLFLPREKVAEYPGVPDEVPEPPAPPAVAGVAACDLKALASLDAVFCQGDFTDGFYAERRKRLFIISQDCSDVRETCACCYAGIKPYPEAGFDLNLSKVSGGYIVDAASGRGQELLDRHPDGLSEPGPDRMAEREANREAAYAAAWKINEGYRLSSSRRMLLNHDTDGLWDRHVSTCVECGACLLACPTCHCFLLYDRKAGKTNERIRTWDACSYAGYARMAGGGSPRPLLIERFRHRYRHKFDYFVANCGFEMCSGCGRCIEGCSGKIDMRRLFKDIESAALAESTQ